MNQLRMKRLLPSLIGILVLMLGLLGPFAASDRVYADQTPDPTSVTIAGSLQSELGCPGDWQPDCANTHLTYDVSDDVWQGTFPVPGGQLGVQGGAQRLMGGELRSQCPAGRAEYPAQSGLGRQRQVLLRPQDPLGHR